MLIPFVDHYRIAFKTHVNVFYIFILNKHFSERLVSPIGYYKHRLSVGSLSLLFKNNFRPVMLNFCLFTVYLKLLKGLSSTT